MDITTTELNALTGQPPATRAQTPHVGWLPALVHCVMPAYIAVAREECTTADTSLSGVAQDTIGGVCHWLTLHLQAFALQCGSYHVIEHTDDGPTCADAGASLQSYRAHV